MMEFIDMTNVDILLFIFTIVGLILLMYVSPLIGGPLMGACVLAGAVYVAQRKAKVSSFYLITGTANFFIFWLDMAYMILINPFTWY
jgi:hypothetical protein